MQRVLETAPRRPAGEMLSAKMASAVTHEGLWRRRENFSSAENVETAMHCVGSGYVRWTFDEAMCELNSILGLPFKSLQHAIVMV